jgi:hypothetical protein
VPDSMAKAAGRRLEGLRCFQQALAGKGLQEPMNFLCGVFSNNADSFSFYLGG